jgi:hypothetical protein
VISLVLDVLFDLGQGELEHLVSSRSLQALLKSLLGILKLARALVSIRFGQVRFPVGWVELESLIGIRQGTTVIPAIQREPDLTPLGVHDMRRWTQL